MKSKNENSDTNESFDSSALLSADVRLCEGIAGMWRYHLCPADDETGTKSLCGKQTMICNSPVDSWGFKSDHMPYSYCAECERIALGR